jgi:hypothetical protein
LVTTGEAVVLRPLNADAGRRDVHQLSVEVEDLNGLP